MKPVICHVLHTLNTGGAEVLACEFGRRHRDAFEVIYVCLDEAGNMASVMQQEGFKVTVLNRKPGFDYGLTKRLHKLFLDENVSIVHAHQYAPFFYSSASRGILANKPAILFTEHGRAFPDMRRPKRCLANRFLLKRHDRVVAVGKQIKQALINFEEIPDKRIEVIYNGVPSERYSTPITTEQRVAMRLSLDTKPDDPVVIQVARLHPLKDHITAIQTFAKTVAQIPNAKLWIVGEGEEHDKIVQEIQRLAIHDKVRLLGNRSDVEVLIHAADAFLLTSISEGIPLTVIEAMFAGIPCVCSNVGGLPEIIEHGRNGLLAPARNPEALSEQLTEVLVNQSRAKSLGLAGKTDAQLRFSDRAMQAAYREVYQQMLSKKR
jgi:glycosyltransferase involved in cell wall biosynthesis